MISRLINYGKYILEVDPACRTLTEALLCYPVIPCLIFHRWAHSMYQKGYITFARLLSQHARRRTGIEIHPGAKIGSKVFIDHGMGVVIGETAEVGDYTTIYHGVTLGGTGNEKSTKRHPTVGKHCILGANSIILGNVTIGDYAKIGAGAIVLSDVPAGATIIGSPKTRTILRDLDQIKNK